MSLLGLLEYNLSLTNNIWFLIKHGKIIPVDEDLTSQGAVPV